MKKNIIITLLIIVLKFFLFENTANATDQYPDYLVMNGEKFELYVDWSFPSPLAIYYMRTAQPSPFESWGTANYRGHVATWEIRDSSLFLVKVDTRPQAERTGTYFPTSQQHQDTLTVPAFWGIKSLGNLPNNNDGSVLADWFSGVIVAKRYLNPEDERIYYSDESSNQQKLAAKNRLDEQTKSNAAAGDFYLLVRQGKVKVMLAINEMDMERAMKISEEDMSDRDFMMKYEMLYLNQSYMLYHLSAGLSHDSVTVSGHGGHFVNYEGSSLIMGYYDNDPVNWPFSWENSELCGAPVPHFEVIHDSIFVTGMRIAYSEGLFDYRYIDVAMDSVFPPEKLQNGRLFATWVNGKQMVQYTVFDDYDELFYEKKYIYKIQRMEVKDGIVLRSQIYPNSFELDGMNDLSRTSHFCNPDQVCCTKFGLWLPVDIKKLPTVTENAAYLEEENSMLEFLSQHPLNDTTINGRFMIGFGLNCNGQADHFWMTDLRNEGVIDWGESILEAIRQLPPYWQPAKYASHEGELPIPIDSYQVIDVTIQDGKFTNAYLHR